MSSKSPNGNLGQLRRMPFHFLTTWITQNLYWFRENTLDLEMEVTEGRKTDLEVREREVLLYKHHNQYLELSPEM